MFGRQWFSHKDQIGLTEPALRMKGLLLEHKFCEAAELAKEQRLTNPSYWRRQYKRAVHISNRLIQEDRYGPIPLKIYFSKFWPQMDACCCQILDFFKAASNERELLVVSNAKDSDIAIFTCYGDLDCLVQTEHSLRVLFLGENVRPSYELFDISLSSDMQSYSGLNGYLPLWLFEIDWFGKQYKDRKTYPMSLFTAERCIDYRERLSNIVYVGNNHEPYRMSIINTMREAGYQVDSFGRHSREVDDKVELYTNYRLCFCPENSFFPGYVTEKLMHSYLGGTAGIYWGCLDSQPFRNHPMIISLRADETKKETLKRIQILSQNLGEARHNYTYPRLFRESEANTIFDKALLFTSKEVQQFIAPQTNK